MVVVVAPFDQRYVSAPVPPLAAIAASPLASPAQLSATALVVA